MAVSKVIINGVTRVDLTGDTVASGNLLSGYTATGADGESVSGGIASKTSSDLTANNNTVTAPAGYYASNATKTVGTAKAAATYNTSTSDQTIPSGQYLTGTQTIKAVTTANISAANVKDGVTVKVGDADDDYRCHGYFY